MIDNRVILHVGFPKTGSSSLQTFLFRPHPEIAFFALERWAGPSDNAIEFTKLIKSMKSLERDSHNRGSEDLGAHFINDVIGPSLADHKVALLSYESLIYHPDAIYRTFPEARLLVVLREPVDYYTSLYLQKLRGLGQKYDRAPPLEEWIRLDRAENGCPYKNLERLLTFYDIDRVEILEFDDLKEDADGFVRSLAAYLGVNQDIAQREFSRGHANPRLTRYELFANAVRARSPWLADRLGTHWLRHTRGFLQQRLLAGPAQIKPRAETIAMIRAACEPSITSIGQRTGINTERYL